MPRQAGSQLIGAGGVTEAPPQIKPEYKIIANLKGGINTSLPPDQISDTETADCLNVCFVNQALGVDFGSKQLGSVLYGIPQQPISWTSAQGNTYSLVLTTKVLYVYDIGLADWNPVPSNVVSNPTITSVAVGTNEVTVYFSGTATWSAGELVSVQQTDGSYLLGHAAGTTSPTAITLAVAGAPIKTIAAGVTINPVQEYFGSGFPISWCVDPIRAYLIYTNGVDHVQTFNGIITADLAGLTAAGITCARYVARYFNVTVLAAPTEYGVFYTYRIRRSATADSTNWTTLNAGFDDLSDTADDITNLILLNPYLVITRRESVMVASYYGSGDQVFWYNYGLANIGTLGLSSSTATRLSSLLITVSGIYNYDGSYGVTDIGEKIFNSFLSFTGELNPLGQDAITCLYVELLDETWIFYPDSQTAITTPTKMLRFSHKYDCWFKREFPSTYGIVGSGAFTLPTTRAWNQLGNVRWIDQKRPWNSRSSASNFPSLLLCNSVNNTVMLYNFSYTDDNGQPISWYYTSKDYPLPEDWVTLDGVVLYGQGILDTCEISIDGGVTYNTLGTNLVFGVRWQRIEMDCSYTTTFLRLRISGTDPSLKLSWFAFKTFRTSEN